MLIYRFLDKNAALATIKDRELRISRISNLNDPFEFLCVDISDRKFRQGIYRAKARLDKTKGLICFSKNWSNPLLWGHYAEKHKGLCLAFKVNVMESYVNPVQYIERRLPRPTTKSLDFAKQILFTKFSHWSYEQEVRMYINLEKERDGHYYLSFSNSLQLNKVIIGCESDATVKEIEGALGDLKNSVEVLKARPAFKEFKVVRNRKEDKYP